MYSEIGLSNNFSYVLMKTDLTCVIYENMSSVTLPGTVSPFGCLKNLLSTAKFLETTAIKAEITSSGLMITYCLCFPRRWVREGVSL